MPLLKMQGRPITNFMLYKQYFEPYDAIRQRERLAGFVMGHMQLDDAMRYHAAMIRTAAEGVIMRGAVGWKANCGPVEVFPNGEKYWQDELGAAPRTLDVDEDMQEGTCALVREMSAFCGQLDAEELPKERICMLLIAAYALADTDLAAHPLDKNKLKAAWERKKAEPVQNEEQTLRGGSVFKECSLPVDAAEAIPTLMLPPDPVPYELKAFDGKMEAQQRICTYRIEADTRSVFGVNAQVLLKVGEEQVAIRRGDHVYVNAIGDAAVCILPDAVEQAGITLENDGGSEDHLNLSFGETLRTIRFAAGQKVTSFAVGETPDNILFIRDGRLCIDYFANRSNFLSLQILQERKVVQVRLIGDHYVVLQDNGRVHSSSTHYAGLRGVTSLNDIEDQWRKYRDGEV